MEYTIKDVAKKAGVSTATVSRVLNNEKKVKEKTREKILKTVREMDFVLNQSAKRLRSKKTRTIGVIVSNILSAFDAEIIKGIEAKAAALNYKILICDCNNTENRKRDEQERLFLKLFNEGSVDGMIMVHPHIEAKDYKYLIEKNFKISVLGRDLDEYNIPSITVDNVAGAYDAVKHLCLHGYKKIAFIYGVQWIDEKLKRINGYKKALEEFSLEIKDEYIVHGMFTEEGGSLAFEKLLNLPEPPDAIFTSNDEMALGVLKTARKMNIKIPEDIALMGYDDTRLCELTTPLLSSVRQPKHQIGTLLAEKLIDSIENKDNELKSLNMILKPELIIRESCGCKMK
jgi:DNA-binding LacI/PurR family transcriptional regulator